MSRKKPANENQTLLAIIAVGYCVRSHRGNQFRRWAMERLNEYLAKGFTMDDDRLKAGVNIGSNYFDDMISFTIIGWPRKPGRNLSPMMSS